MRKFTFLRPFPECPQLMDPLRVSNMDCFIGPFTLAEAMRIFWKLKSVSIAIEWDVRIWAQNPGAEPTLQTDTSGVSVWKNTAYAHHYCNREPLMRCKPTSVFMELASPKATFSRHISKPLLMRQYPAATRYDEMEYFFDMNFYCLNYNADNPNELLGNTTCTHMGTPFENPTPITDWHHSTLQTSQITLLGRPVNVYFSIERRYTDKSIYLMSYSHSVSAEEEYWE